VGNYPTNTGYAWDFIESLYAEIARRLAPHGIRTVVAYPRIDGPPRTLEGSSAIAVALDATLTSVASVEATGRFVREHDVRAIYLTDQPARSAAYRAIRRHGVARVIVHDHASGARSTPSGVRRLIKWTLARVPGLVADDVIAVSDFVARRQVESGLIPPGRVTRVWNGTPVPPLPEGRLLHAALDLDPSRPVIACACRCAPEKGVPVLLRAFDRLAATWPAATPRPVLVYMGDGPQFVEVTALRETLPSRDDIVLTGYRRDAGALVGTADVCAMPSLWQDALPLAVMQPMALGRAVVASAVGGIPEMIVDGTTGVLVPPADIDALAAALAGLAGDPARAARLGQAARARVAELFTPERQFAALTAIVARAWPAVEGLR
jgi:glycosyltransferase involved in cell wall biosynthesis